MLKRTYKTHYRKLTAMCGKIHAGPACGSRKPAPDSGLIEPCFTYSGAPSCKACAKMDEYLLARRNRDAETEAEQYRREMSK